MALDTLGATKLRTMLRYVTFRLGDAYAEAEPVLLEQVAKSSSTPTRPWCCSAGGPGGSTRTGREPKSWDDNELDLHHTYQGGWHAPRQLSTPRPAPRLAAALDAEAEAIYRAGGTDGQRLSLGRRRAMALMEIIRRNHDPAHADTQVPPTVMVTITLDELLKQLRAG